MVDGWRSPQKPEGPSGRRCEDWTRRKELLFPDAGIMVRDRRIPPDTRLAGSTPCLIPGVHRDHNLALDSPALIRGFRVPALCEGGTAPGAGARKPPKEETAGEVWGLFVERAYGDLRIADGCRTGRRQPAALVVFGGSGGGGRFRWRQCAEARRRLRSQEDWRPRTGVALVFRLAAGRSGDRWCAAGCGATVMNCRS
jgi:hypothetical protein